MTEKQIANPCPSIQNIETSSRPEKFCLSEAQTNSLFVSSELPKFDLSEIRKEDVLTKHPLTQFFIHKIQMWNRAAEGQKKTLNMRTEYLLTDFLYSSLKRISMMKDSQVDAQLKVLYKWFTGNGKQSEKQSVSMPKKINENEAYEAVKSFKTNPTLLIDQYRRKYFDSRFSKRAAESQKGQIAAMNQTFNTNLKKKMENNFITNPGDSCKDEYKAFTKDQFKPFLQPTEKGFHRQNKPIEVPSKFLRKVRSNENIWQDEVRRYREAVQLRKSQEKWKHEKSRLMQEISKNYFEGQFDSCTRFIRSSQAQRTTTREQLSEIKEYRVQTTYSKRREMNRSKQNVIPEICEVGGFSLMKNPQELKVKKKKKAGKRN